MNDFNTCEHCLKTLPSKEFITPFKGMFSNICKNCMRIISLKIVKEDIELLRGLNKR